ncbi:MAG: DNA polymerase IV [Hyphomonas sp.]
MNTVKMPSLCRDCLHTDLAPFAQCPKCGHQRCITHNSLFSLNIAHMDCDAFFAAIEKRDDPSLKNKPVIVGGGTRGVVATCCYIARLYGVRSAMPAFQALKLCPDAVVVKPNGAKYSAAAKTIREMMDALTPLVQPVSIDEAYMDLSGTETMHGAPPAVSLARLARDIERDVGITVSIGLSSNKFLAKTASEEDKPKGFFVISPDEAEAFLGPKPVGFLHGVGPKLAANLNRAGFETVADLQATDLKSLAGQFGETGFWLKQRAHGEDNRPVRNDRERKSISSETTFNTDIADLALLEDELWRLCVKTADRAKAVGSVGHVVTLKLKTQNFKTLTRRISLSGPTQLSQEIFRAARPLLKKETATGRRFRLIGVGLSNLDTHKADGQDLLDPMVAKRAAAERASDIAREKFGKEAVQTGRLMRRDHAYEARKASEKKKP